MLGSSALFGSEQGLFYFFFPVMFPPAMTSIPTSALGHSSGTLQHLEPLTRRRRHRQQEPPKALLSRMSTVVSAFFPALNAPSRTGAVSVTEY
jgi:hypothetical protein